MEKQVPPSQEDDSLFLEAVGGWSEKGTVYGLGNSAALFYEKPVNHTTFEEVILHSLHCLTASN